MPEVKDDRDDQQRKTHTAFVVATDRFMGVWGRRCGKIGPNGRSIVAWACQPKHVHQVMRWVSSRGDMSRVRLQSGRVYARSQDHVHIHVADDKHVSIRQEA